MRRFLTAYKFYRHDHGTFPRWQLPMWRSLLGAWRFARNSQIATPSALKAFRVTDRINADLHKQQS